MPIILLWNAAAAPYAAQVGRWLDEMARSTFLLHLWLRKRLEEAERLDRFSASFPVFAFYNMSLTARVADAQFGALLTQPIAGVGAHVERALEQWNLPEDIRVQARSANLPREALRVIEEITLGVLSSLRRFEKPTPAMFNPRERTASDLIGLAALTFRTVGANRDGLLAAAYQLKFALAGGATRQSPLSRVGGGDANEAQPGLPKEMRVDEITRYVAGALLVIPALSELFGRIGGDALVALRYSLLAQFERIERLAHGFRRRIFLALRDGMAAFAEATLQFMARIAGLAIRYIDAFTRIGVDYLRGVVDGVSAFIGEFDTFWRGVTDLIDRVGSFGTALISIDIGEVVHLGLVAVQEAIDFIWWFHELYNDLEEYKAPEQFPVTIGEIVMEEGAGAKANREIRTALTRLSKAADEANVVEIVRWFSDTADREIGSRVKGLVLLSDALALPRAPKAVQPSLTFDASSAKNLVTEVVTPLRNGLTRAVADIGTAADRGVGDIFSVTTAALDQTARKFSEESATAATTRPMRLLNRFTGNTDALLDTLFGNQVYANRKTGLEPAAGVFEAWLLQGGFDTVGRVAAGYIRFVLDEWMVHLAENRDTPVPVTATSPKRLLERAQLGRVHLPELRIVAKRHPLGGPLAGRVASEFRGAVQGAYRTGLDRLGQYAKAAAAAAATP